MEVRVESQRTESFVIQGRDARTGILLVGMELNNEILE